MQTQVAETKTDRELEDRMLAFAGDEERVEVIGRARVFKRSWIELAEALSGVYARKSWERWGHESFDVYCRKELHITPSTASKLLGSFRFLKSHEPTVIERTREQPTAPIPSMKAVDFVARATERGAADEDTLEEIRRAAFEEGAEAPMLARRFKTVAFPVSEKEKAAKVRSQVETTARKLATLIAEPDADIPHEVAVAVEEAIGELLGALGGKK